MIIQYARCFDRQYAALSAVLQRDVDHTVLFFLKYFTSRQFPKGLRVHKCGRFLSLTVTMSYRVFVLPIRGGVKFVFVGNHKDAENYLKKQ